MKKQFRLEQDMPNLKAGAIFYEKKTTHEEFRTYHVDSDNFGHPFFLFADTVENNPEWFSIVITEELIKNAINEMRKQPFQILIKPPIGILPRYIHEAERIDCIKEAMGRLQEENKKVPVAWLEEYNELISKQKGSL